MQEVDSQKIEEMYSEVDLSQSLDFEVLRAQMLNCVYQAVSMLNNGNPGLNAGFMLDRIGDMTLVFTLISNAEGGPRTYIFKLRDPNGSEAYLQRVNHDGVALPLESIDTALSTALGTNLKTTVNKAYSMMAKKDIQPTHTAAYVLH